MANTYEFKLNNQVITPEELSQYFPEWDPKNRFVPAKSSDAFRLPVLPGAWNRTFNFPPDDVAESLQTLISENDDNAFIPLMPAIPSHFLKRWLIGVASARSVDGTLIVRLGMAVDSNYNIDTSKGYFDIIPFVPSGETRDPAAVPVKAYPNNTANANTNIYTLIWGLEGMALVKQAGYLQLVVSYPTASATSGNIFVKLWLELLE